MEKMPVVICSSVIRSAQQGESHGGIYLVDLERGTFKQEIDWNDIAIDWSGRGGDRGLRGIAFYDDFIICAASDEIFFFDQNFEIQKSFKNKYLRHCHEIYVEKDFLYLSSTGFDSILVFNLKEERFEKGFCYSEKGVFNVGFLHAVVRRIKRKFTQPQKVFKLFDPNMGKGPVLQNQHHINNVFKREDGIYFSGTKLNFLMKIDHENKLTNHLPLPYGTHNPHLYDEFVIYNDTSNDQLVVRSLKGSERIELPIPKYSNHELIHSNLPKDHARQSFGRGLCVTKEYLISGSSPSTINVFSLTKKKLIKSVNLTLDIRNAIHGLEVYPYETTDLE